MRYQPLIYNILIIKVLKSLFLLTLPTLKQAEEKFTETSSNQKLFEISQS